jgi:hypothetical protein
VTFGDDRRRRPGVEGHAAHGALYAGVEPAGLFRDDGASHLVPPVRLTGAFLAPEWRLKRRLCIRSIVSPH